MGTLSWGVYHEYRSWWSEESVDQFHTPVLLNNDAGNDSRYNVTQYIACIPAGTWHGNGVIVASGRRRFDVKTTLRCRFGVMVALLLRNVSAGHGH